MDRERTKQHLAASGLRHYVYLLHRPCGTPFYVGKGQGTRIFHHEIQARGPQKTHKLNIIRALRQSEMTIAYSIDSFHKTEADALARECALIQHYGRHDLKTGCLANMTDGCEGAVNLSEESKEKHRATLWGTEGDSERSIANRFFAQLHKVESVTIKPMKGYKVVPLTPHSQPRKPTTRAAATLAASAIANRVLLEVGALLPRKIILDDMVCVIENGVGRDILRSGLANLHGADQPADECFLLTSLGVSYVLQIIDQGLLLDAGILMPQA